MMPRNLRMTGVNEEEFDPTLKEKLTILNSAKKTAIESEDYDKAKGLKEVIDNLRVSGN